MNCFVSFSAAKASNTLAETAAQRRHVVVESTDVAVTVAVVVVTVAVGVVTVVVTVAVVVAVVVAAVLVV